MNDEIKCFVYRAVLEKYSRQLSPPAFSSFIHLYNCYVFDNFKLSDDEIIQVNSAMDELENHQLVKLINATPLGFSGVELNISKIANDSGKMISRKDDFFVPLKGVNNSFDQLITKFTGITQKKLLRLKSGIEKYLHDNGKILSNTVVYKLLAPFFRASEHDIVEVCDIYSKQENFGKKNIGYVHGILRTVENDEKSKIRKIKQKSKMEFAKMRVEND